MPKKRQGQALLIKPGSSASSPVPTSRHNDSGRPSVNDLIRESRRLQFKKESPTSPAVTASVPPQIRQALNLPAPEAPIPRPGARNGPSRFRRIPGPPPPRSWLTDSRNAPQAVRDHVAGSVRLQKRTSTLPGAAFPPPESLQHFALRQLALNWDWHADYYGEFLVDLPTKTREALLSYLAVYGDNVRANPLRLLFLTDTDTDSRAEVTRLDLTDALGSWTTMKQLEKSLRPVLVQEIQNTSTREVPDTWDDGMGTTSPAILSLIPSGAMFKNLQHVSLALKPGATRSALWKDLIHVAEKIPTITSLSLANWPTPTYTPRAASTRAIVQSSSSRPQTIYGGTNLYTAFDNDWREAAGILRSLSRSLYCLKWFDLTGCGPWLPALTWKPDEGAGGREWEGVGPEWNGCWRGIEHMCLAVGWEPVEANSESGVEEEEHQRERQRHLNTKENEEHSAMSASARLVARELRAIRKEEGGRWIAFDF